ncbi:MauE/DoxX family redox-associated membrane protein [Kibdelosporangium philippinense]
MEVLVAAVLLWAAVFKLRGGSKRSALGKLVGKHRTKTAFRIIGVVEIGLAISLPVPAGKWAVAAWFLGLFGYLMWARVAAPDSSCGCLSDKFAPVGMRAIVRSLVLAGAVFLPWQAVMAAVAIVLLSAERDGERATAVFAVPLQRDEPEAVRFALA